MRFGTVKDGKVEFDGKPLAEGSRVVVVGPGESVYVPTAEEEEQLVVADNECEQGDYVSAADHIAELTELSE